MACKACHHDHPAMQTCGTAARLRLAQGLVDHARIVATVPVAAPGKPPLAVTYAVTYSPEVTYAEPKAVTYRMKEWRDKNRERNRAYNREYMKRKRANGKPAPQN